MHETILVIAVLLCVGLAACAGLIVAAGHPERVRRFLRHPSLGRPRGYRTALRGWLARRRARPMPREAEKFRNLQARFTAWGRRRRD